MTEALIELTATELLALYRKRKLSPVEVTRAVLQRIADVDPKVNAFCLVDAEAALEAAQASEQRWMQGAPKGLLDGVPASIKDLLLTKGWPTLRGSRMVEPKQPWTEDAPTVARLREHGAVLLGKTTTPEFGWKAVTDSALTGATRNPWDLGRTPGGSSGGAAAQLAARMGPLATGTDGGGSIRIPAAFSGVVGLKPSYGRVPAWPQSPYGTVAHVGPMARSVADTALLLTVMAQPDARDWQALPFDGRDWRDGIDTGVRGLKVAFSPRLGYAEVDAEIAQAVERAARAFAELGAAVEQTDPGFADPAEVFWTHWVVGAWNALGSFTPEQKALLEPGLAQSVETGARTTLAEYLKAVNARVALGSRMRLFHERYDLLLTPAVAVPPLPVGRLLPDGWPEHRPWIGWTPFSFPFNLTQQPAISVPCGFTGTGLPIGLQIVGPMHREDLVLRAAHAYEAAHPTTGRLPPL